MMSVLVVSNSSLLQNSNNIFGHTSLHIYKCKILYFLNPKSMSIIFKSQNIESKPKSVEKNVTADMSLTSRFNNC